MVFGLSFFKNIGGGRREWELGGGGDFFLACFSMKIPIHDSTGQTITGN